MNQTTFQSPIMTVKQVADYLQMKESTIYAWTQSRKIPAIKIGRTWRFWRDDIDAWLKKHTIKTADDES